MGNCCRAQGAGALCSVTAWRGGIGSGQLKREGTHVYLRLTHISCMAEANTTLLSNYLQLKKKKTANSVSLSESLGKTYESQIFNNRVVLVEGFS